MRHIFFTDKNCPNRACPNEALTTSTVARTLAIKNKALALNAYGGAAAALRTNINMSRDRRVKCRALTSVFTIAPTF